MRHLVLLLALIALPAPAAVYRWVDAQGNVHYGDSSPNRQAQPAKLPPLQFITAQPLSAAAKARSKAAQDRSPASAPSTAALRIVSPQADEVFRRTDRSLPISVALSQPLAEGSGLIFRVDGNPANRAPVQASSYTATDIDRGSHLVDVSVVDAGGRELGRSAPVLVHLKPPGVR